MSGDTPFAAKIVSPVKCNEKPWDLWVSELGHLSPRRDEEQPDTKALSSPRHPHGRAGPHKARARRVSHNRLRLDSMSLHGLFPQMDNLNAAVCHMCGVIVKCSAAYKHLLESHTDTEPILPPPAVPTPRSKVFSRSRHKKDSMAAPIPVVDLVPVKMDTSPVHTAPPPLPRIVSLPQQELYLEEASTSAAGAGEVQVCMESGELPVVSIQDPEELPLGENITDDIFAIMNSEGIESADDITNTADWKNIIRDIGNMQEINFPQTTDSNSRDLYATVDASTLSAYAIPDTDLSNLQFAPNPTPMLPSVIDTNVLNVNTQALKPAASAPVAAVAPTTPSTKSSSRSKTSKTKFNLREYDPNKHCGVVTADNPKPCTRSLTCKAHALSLRRTVVGRAKPFDQLLAEHRAQRDAAQHPPTSQSAVTAALHPPPVPPPPQPAPLPSLLVNSSIDLGAFNGLTAEQQVNDIYASLLSVEDPNALLGDPAALSSLLAAAQPLPADLLLPDDAELPADVPLLSIASPPPEPPAPPPAARPDDTERSPPPLVPTDVCWYSTCPRPLALCTFNASHAGSAITLGKRFATVRSNIKSSLSRSQKTTSVNNYYYGQNALSLSKTVHMNASKTNKPEVRKLIVTCSGRSDSDSNKQVEQTLSELFGTDVRHTLNGHVGSAGCGPSAGGRRPSAGGGAGKAGAVGHKRPGPPPLPSMPTVLDLGFNLDPLLADEKC